MNLPAAETAGYLKKKDNRESSFPLVGNPSEKKDSGQARMTAQGNPTAETVGY